MHSTSPRLMRHGLAAAALVLALPVWAQSSPNQYQQERAACAAMSNPESRTNCLRDLGAARQQAQRNPRPATSPEVLQRNALQRCQAHKDSENRMICERMARGEGEVSGSVSGGGQIRSIETTIPGTGTPPAMPAPNMPPPAMQRAPMGSVPPMSAPPTDSMRPPVAPPTTLPPLSTPPSSLPPPAPGMR